MPRYRIYLEETINPNPLVSVVAHASYRRANEAPPEWVDAATRTMEINAADDAAAQQHLENIADAQFASANRRAQAPSPRKTPS